MTSSENPPPSITLLSALHSGWSVGPPALAGRREWPGPHIRWARDAGPSQGEVMLCFKLRTLPHQKHRALPLRAAADVFGQECHRLASTNIELALRYASAIQEAHDRRARCLEG